MYCTPLPARRGSQAPVFFLRFLRFGVINHIIGKGPPTLRLRDLRVYSKPDKNQDIHFIGQSESYSTTKQRRDTPALAIEQLKQLLEFRSLPLESMTSLLYPRSA